MEKRPPKRPTQRPPQRPTKRVAKKVAPAQKREIERKARAREKNTNLEAHRRKKKISSQKFVSISATIALTFVFIFVFGYFARGVFKVLDKQTLATTLVEYGSVDLPDVLSGVIIRDEVVYTSSTKGTVVFNYNDYDRVKKDADICSVQNDETVKESNENYESVNQEILDLQSRRGEYSSFSAEAKRINAQIQLGVENNLASIMSGQFSSVYTMKNNVAQNINLRNHMLISEDRGSVSPLLNKKANYEEKLNQSISFVKAKESGVLCYTVDGMEQTLSFETMETLTPEQTRMKIDYSEIPRKNTVSENESVFKIVGSNDWYVAVYAQNEVISDWKEQDVQKVYIEKNGTYVELVMEIAKIDKKDKTSLLLLKSKKNMVDFLDARNVSVKLTDSYHKGIKIPYSTIVEKTLLKIPKAFVLESTTGATILKKGETAEELIKIVVKKNDEQFDYIFYDLQGALKIGDVILNPEDKSKTFTIADIVNVKGVFILNNGYADFEKIEIAQDMVEKGGYIVLDTQLNANIAVNDKIINETKALVDGQKLE